MARAAYRKNRGPHRFLVGIITFLLGYGTASVFDIETVTQWVNTKVLAHEEKPAPVKNAPHTAQLPKPKFEFYTLLANDKVPSTAKTVQITKNTAVGIPPDPLRKTNAQPDIPDAAALAAKEVQHHSVAIKTPVIAAQSMKPDMKYTVQVAAFKAQRDAEQLKGTLILKGYSASIASVSNAKGNWFRVVVGPYADKASAQNAQAVLAEKEHLRGLVGAAG